MAKNEYTRRRILAVERMFQTGKALSIAEIQRKLEHVYAIPVDRKTLYADICDLTMFLPITVVGCGRNTRYQIINVC